MHVLILSLDTSSRSGSVAVLNDGILLAVISTTTDEIYSSRIFRHLEFLLSDLSLTLNRFDLFAVNAGPGSFTGLRVGLTAAKAWSEAFCKPVAAVSGLETVAMQAIAGTEWIVPVMDARRGQVYTASYRYAPASAGVGAILSRASEDMVVTPEEFSCWLRQSPHLNGATLATASSAWLISLLSARDQGAEARANVIMEVSPVLAPFVGQLAYRKAQRGETADALRLDANYVRRSDAELNWKVK